MRQLFLFILLLVSFTTYASVDIAFVPMRNADGSILQFEEGGRFVHMAVSFRGQWLHAHPKNGVELTRDLSGFGDEMLVLTSDHFNEPSEEFVKANLGKAFSYLKPWDDENYSYCAKLVAKIFDIKPSIMTFSSDRWKNRTNLPRGKLGTSADKLFRVFVKRGFKVKWNSCEESLNPYHRQVRPLYNAK